MIWTLMFFGRRDSTQKKLSHFLSKNPLIFDFASTDVKLPMMKMDKLAPWLEVIMRGHHQFQFRQIWENSFRQFGRLILSQLSLERR